MLTRPDQHQPADRARLEWQRSRAALNEALDVLEAHRRDVPLSVRQLWGHATAVHDAAEKAGKAFAALLAAAADHAHDATMARTDAEAIREGIKDSLADGITGPLQQLADALRNDEEVA
jgi:hypothetical protein